MNSSGTSLASLSCQRIKTICPRIRFVGGASEGSFSSHGPSTRKRRKPFSRAMESQLWLTAWSKTSRNRLLDKLFKYLKRTTFDAARARAHDQTIWFRAPGGGGVRISVFVPWFWSGRILLFADLATYKRSVLIFTSSGLLGWQMFRYCVLATLVIIP